MRRCYDCGIEQPLGAFNKGASYCKPCHRARAKAYYAANRAEIRAKSNATRAANRDKYREYGRAFYARHRDEVRAQVQAYRLANPMAVAARKKAWAEKNKERLSAKSKAYAAANAARLRERRAAWYVANAEAVRAKVKADRLANPEKIKARKDAYQAVYRDEIKRRNKARRLLNPERYRAYAKENYRRNPTPYKEHAHLRRARIQGVFVEKVRVAVLYKRDRGRCQICKVPCAVDQASIDHIIPVSRGGEHSYRNTQLAHLDCNLRRNVYGPAQIRLLG